MLLHDGPGHSAGIIAESSGTRRLLIVAPHFPPINAPDAQRVRMSLRHYREFGWEPHVLTVDPGAQAGARDPLQSLSVPGDVPVTRVGALPVEVTGLFGIGDVALRSLWQLARAGHRILRRERTDLVLFSTSLFFSVPLGRWWRARTGVPFVVDMQDPWAEDRSRTAVGLKRRLAGALHRRLERWTMRRASGVLAVSPAYIDVLRSRYPWLGEDVCATVPFGIAPEDLDIAARHATPAIGRSDGRCRGVYVGAGGPGMATALRVLFGALRRMEAADPSVARSLVLSFIGTDYAPAGTGRPTVLPIAQEAGIACDVSEQTDRIGYFEALRTLQVADFVLLIGSDDPQYTASKALPCIAAQRPLLAIVHADSPVNGILARYDGAVVVPFRGPEGVDDAIERLVTAWPRLMAMAGREQPLDWERFEAFGARALTAAQCALFDRVLAAAGALR
ncbi:MAG TPA: glycosyltransferase [Vicinamibacterales bacterium]